jgi:hypothetical protein
LAGSTSDRAGPQHRGASPAGPGAQRRGSTHCRPHQIFNLVSQKHAHRPTSHPTALYLDWNSIRRKRGTGSFGRRWYGPVHHLGDLCRGIRAGMCVSRSCARGTQQHRNRMPNAPARRSALAGMSSSQSPPGGRHPTFMGGHSVTPPTQPSRRSLQSRPPAGKLPPHARPGRA